ncbi:hypothetical protein EVJ58_g7296, partial [Rhodofomes roseus]
LDGEPPAARAYPVPYPAERRGQRRGGRHIIVQRIKIVASESGPLLLIVQIGRVSPDTLLVLLSAHLYDRCPTPLHAPAPF